MASGGRREGSGTKRDDIAVATALYRHFSSDGDLLYVGVSCNPIQRLSQHIAKSDWWNEIATVTIEKFETRALARAAEVEAIRSERPMLNCHENRKPMRVAANDNRSEFVKPRNRDEAFDDVVMNLACQ
jgi:hypothetical protein